MADEFAKIYEDYFDDVFKLVYRRIPNREVAEDIVQDTFLVALKRGEEFLEHPKPKAFLFRTASNKILELYRMLKRYSTDPLEEENPELVREDPGYGEVELNLSALATIGEKEWNLIKRYYLDEIPAKELAEAEAMTENNLRVKLFRFRKKLRDGIL